MCVYIYVYVYIHIDLLSPLRYQVIITPGPPLRIESRVAAKPKLTKPEDAAEEGGGNTGGGAEKEKKKGE